MSEERMESAGGKGVCSECGQAEFTWGRLLGADEGRVKFCPDGPFSLLVSTHEKVRVRRCNGCGNLQMFSEG